ncbi:MAG: hypothetical protein PHD96_00800, partial [Candidatus Pacebacteria bacterium]|nr:hypothetical protein [Candidatus Paceibacterota bacterium]
RWLVRIMVIIKKKMLISLLIANVESNVKLQSIKVGLNDFKIRGFGSGSLYFFKKSDIMLDEKT